MSSPASPRRRSVLLAVGFVLVAINLRLAIAAVSPVLVQIQSALGLSAAEAGLLTTIPVVCFGAFAFVTPRLRRRVGPEGLLAVVLVALAAGIVLRVLPTIGALFGGTVLIGASIAVGNVLLPGVIKADFPHRVALMTGLYSMSLSAGAAVSAGLTVPIERVTDRGWRLAVGAWAVPALGALLLWCVALVLRRRAGVRGAPPGAAPRHLGSLWRDRVAWAVTAFMGIQSLGFYATLAWIPTLFEERHLSAARAGWLLSYSSFPAIVASLVTPGLARRLRRRGLPLVVVIVCYAVAYLGLALAPVAAPYLWMTVLGLAQGGALSLALGAIVLRAPDPEHTGELSMMAQGCGYLLACIGPVLLGLVHQWTGSWRVPMLLLLALLVPFAVSGVAAGKERHVRRTGVPAREASGAA